VFFVFFRGHAQFGFQREPAALRGGARLQLPVRIKLLGKIFSHFNSTTDGLG
jgi:hypothetical protein